MPAANVCGLQGPYKGAEDPRCADGHIATGATNVCLRRRQALQINRDSFAALHSCVVIAVQMMYCSWLAADGGNGPRIVRRDLLLKKLGELN